MFTVRDNEGYTVVLNVTAEVLSKGHPLQVQLCAAPYRTDSSKAWSRTLATITEPNAYTFKLDNDDLRSVVEGPYDYCLRVSLLQSDGQYIESRDTRLSSEVPSTDEKGAYEHENRESLKQLQAFAVKASSITFAVEQLNAEVGPIGQSTPITLTPSDAKTVRELITRMRSVKTEIILAEYDQIQTFNLLDSSGNILTSLDLIHVVSEAYVSPEDVAYNACFALSNEDHATLCTLLYRLSNL
ncbi:MAG: hypothetical protein IKW38_07275 [Kiritimatiellae bacterium]|nr:hypothetical protein [Kiritimatiellia bacterium]